MIILLLRIVMVLFVIWLFAALIKDYKESGTKLSEVSMGEKAAYAVMGFVLNLLDTLGVGSNATQAAFFKFTKLSPDEELPGNGNVIFGIPVIVEALLFMTVIDVDTLTLFSMLIAAMLGGIVGGKVIAHLPVQKIRTILSITLPCVAVILVCKVNGFGPFGLMGDATALTDAKLIISIVINFVLGMLMCAGVGLYAPCMALCALMGLNITVAFPIMMGSCALLMPPASMEFIKAGRYNRKAALIASVTGILGVLAAYYIVKSMPVDILTYIVAVVLIYMAITFIISNKKDKENKAK